MDIKSLHLTQSGELSVPVAVISCLCVTSGASIKKTTQSNISKNTTNNSRYILEHVCVTHMKAKKKK